MRILQILNTFIKRDSVIKNLIVLLINVWAKLEFVCLNILFVTLRFLFILVLLLNISLHRRPLALPANG